MTIFERLKKIKSPLGVAFVILKNDDKFIFQQRDDRPNVTSSGLYAGFGGAIEGNESPLEAALRELQEEISLPIDSSQLVLLGEIDITEISGGTRHAFMANVDSEDFEVYEGQGKVSFTKSELKKINMGKFSPTTRVAIKRYILET